MPWRGNVQCPPGGQLDTGGQRVDVRCAVGGAVQNRAGGVLVGLQARECSRLPLLDDLGDLGGRGVVLGCPRDDAGCIAPLVRTGICHLGDQVWIAAQHRDLSPPVTVVVTLLKQVAHRAGGAALAMAQKFDMHANSPRRGRRDRTGAVRRVGAARAGWRPARRAAVDGR